MNKKFIALLAAVPLLSVSCGARTQTNKVAFVGMPGVSEYFTSMQTEFKKQFQAEGQNADDVNGSFDPAEQVNQCNLFLDNNPDYLFIWPNNPDNMTNVVKKAHNQGTKVISFVEEIADSDAYIVTDPRELAGQSADIASKWINTKFANAAEGSVKVAVVYDNAKTNVVWQAESMRDKIKQNSKVNQDVTFVTCEEGTDKGKSWADTNLTKDVNVILTPNCSTGMGISNSMLNDKTRDINNSAIFTVNVQSGEDIGRVASSKDNACLVRGAANAGNGAEGTINDFVTVYKTLKSGNYTKGFRQLSINTYLYEDQFRGNVEDITIN